MIQGFIPSYVESPQRMASHCLATSALHHCYQEHNQDEKFAAIVRAISDLNIDIVCFQEVCENWNNGKGDWRSNSARIIKEHLKKSYSLSYHLYTDWTHIGFGEYREGVAILSRYGFLAKGSAYVSSSRDFHDIHCRKAAMAQVNVPYMGLVNVYSVHLSWWDSGFRDQFESLGRWVRSKCRVGVSATLLCGDFNIKAGSEGYALVVDSGDYDDQFLEAASPDLFHRILKQPSYGWESDLAHDYRIDYIFKKKEGSLKVTSARALFTEQDYGRVSDHYGYLMEFEPI